jgi:hypothetical protein
LTAEIKRDFPSESFLYTQLPFLHKSLARMGWVLGRKSIQQRCLRASTPMRFSSAISSELDKQKDDG